MLVVNMGGQIASNLFDMITISMQGLPVPFCKLFLPNKDTTVTIEDENGEEFGVKYIANKTGLSAGWRKFVSGNKLLEGDVLIFQLVGPCRFKVIPRTALCVLYWFFLQFICYHNIMCNIYSIGICHQGK